MSDQVTVQLANPAGWLYVDQLDDDRWGWEARLGGFHLDAGIEATKDDALARAREAIARERSNQESASEGSNRG